MRDILHRGKRKDTGKWVYGGYFTDGKKHFIIIRVGHIPNTRDLDEAEYYEKNPIYLPEFIEVIPETVGQFTELTDIKGNMVFEGDILREKYHPERDVIVEWNDGRYSFMERMKPRVYGYSSICVTQKSVGRLKNIGNIYDNPELIKRWC